MARRRNPFTPTFGIVPTYLAGRDALLDNMAAAFEDGVGNPDLCTFLIGPRGSGKTALLSCIGNEAREQGWVVVDSVAEKGMLEDILQHFDSEASRFLPPEPARRLSGMSIGEVVGLEWETADKAPTNWRMSMEARLKEVTKGGSGLLITVDEVRVDVDEMIQLASTYQLLVRQGLNVALVMAGLPSNVTELVEDRRVSFLRRARQRQLGILADYEVERAFRKTLEIAGATIDAEALDVAVAASQGFPYMIQLVGYFMWAESDGTLVISGDDARLGAHAAMKDFTTGILERTWGEMSNGDRAFARAMLPDTQGSTLTQVAQRMGKTTSYASTYKRRLMRQGVIGNRPNGTFDFDIPLMRSFLTGMEVADWG